jgi:hypothetical protein
LASSYTHERLNALFMAHGLPGDPPEGSKPAKCMAWLRRANAEVPDPLANFGQLIAEFMDAEITEPIWAKERQKEGVRARIQAIDTDPPAAVADLAIVSGDPLAAQTRVVQTWIACRQVWPVAGS